MSSCDGVEQLPFGSDMCVAHGACMGMNMHILSSFTY